MLSKQTKLLHLEKLGLEFNPFPVVPDAHNYFNTDRMYKSIFEILHCIEARKGFILISGDVGLGKTTLSQLLLLKLANKGDNTALVLNTFLQSGSLLKAINKDFNIKVDSINIEDQLDALNEFLLERYNFFKEHVFSTTHDIVMALIESPLLLKRCKEDYNRWLYKINGLKFIFYYNLSYDDRTEWYVYVLRINFKLNEV